MNIDTVFGIIFGILLAGIAIGMWRYAKRKDARCSECTVGQIVDNELVTERELSGGFSSSYFPIVRFRPNGREELTVRHKVGAKPPRYKIGERVDVKYNPDKPGEFVLPRDYKGMGIISAIFFLAGIGTFGNAAFSIITALLK